ncbi:RHS repeat-associated core domain-containing protein, partial [Pectobacterium versatile]|uniref:RHS repeat-associated core domain-containing protein n=1 Tax=Pectobacterium versatile TaxID=2488639 RepID=UPI001B38507E
SGRLSSLGIGSHQPLQFSHTAAGEEQRRTNGSGFALRHEWSPTGLLQRQALEGADGRVNDVLERRYQYDVLDRLTGISDSHWGEQAFRLNGAGQVTAERRDEGRRRQARLFGYDSEQNLCEVSQIAPGLGETLKVQDAVVQASARYDTAGRVVERGHTLYRYDDCGRLAMKRETRPGFRPKETYFDWDVQDRLVRVSLPDGARWRYRYDAFGRRINKVREGQLPSAQAVARVAYRWDGDQLIGQQQYYADGSAAREVQWVYEPGSFRPLAQVEAQGDSTQLHYIVTDLTGTARELCSEEGEIRWRGEQGLWGTHREERRPIPLRRYLGDAANEEVYCELRYQGQLYDAETGLYYNRHRYYDAESGQYLSPDPIGLLGGMRPQGYVTNPLMWIDPLGLSNSSILDKAMGGQVGDKLSAHHVIPVEVWKDNSEFFDKIGMGDKMNSVFNGIHVPGSKAAMDADLGKGMGVFHSSNHNNYSEDVRRELENIKSRFSDKELDAKSARDARDAVRKLQIDMKNKIWRGDVTQTKCGRMN